jgi:DNA polymerase alpha subunit B
MVKITPALNRQTNFDVKALETSVSTTSGIPFSTRINSGQVIQQLHPELSTRGQFSSSTRRPLGLRCEVTQSVNDFDNIAHRYRYMYTTMNERSAALEKHLLNLQKDLCELNHIEEDILLPVNQPSQSMAWYCGRLCCEAEGKMNAKSVMLEGSFKFSNGRRVMLDLSEVGNFSLFPGQIVLVEGINTSGKSIVVSKIIDGVKKPHLPVDSLKLDKFHKTTDFQNNQPLEVMVACGPFTTSDNLDYQPLDFLLQNVIRQKPDVLLLVGPFVDISQPTLSSGNVIIGSDVNDQHSASFEMVFVEKIVRDNLQALFNSEDEYGVIPTHIVMVPSLLDGHHEFVFPQPPFGDRDSIKTPYFEDALGELHVPFSKASDSRHRVHLMSNPCMFR